MNQICYCLILKVFIIELNIDQSFHLRIQDVKPNVIFKFAYGNISESFYPVRWTEDIYFPFSLSLRKSIYCYFLHVLKLEVLFDVRISLNFWGEESTRFHKNVQNTSKSWILNNELLCKLWWTDIQISDDILRISKFKIFN